MYTSRELNDEQKKIGLERAKALVRMKDADKLPNLIFSDKKMFCIEQHVGKQNDSVWFMGHTINHSDQLRVTCRQGATQIIVWTAISEKSSFSLVFMPKKNNINWEVYRTHVLKAQLVSWNAKIFENVKK